MQISYPGAKGLITNQINSVDTLVFKEKKKKAKTHHQKPTTQNTSFNP